MHVCTSTDFAPCTQYESIKEEHVSFGLATTRPQRNVFLLPLFHSLATSTPTASNARESGRIERGSLPRSFPAATNGSLNLVMSGAFLISCHARELLNSQRAKSNGAVNRFPSSPRLSVASCLRPFRSTIPPCRCEVSPGNSPSCSSQPEANQSEA